MEGKEPLHAVSEQFTDPPRSLYKGLYPLWGRQIPYTMMKFASFENIVAAIYNYLPGQKSDYGSGAQTAVAFAGGYMAGILCAIVSHPADVMVSKLNADRAPGEGFGAAIGRIYGKIGFAGLWNGLPVRIVMIGTLTGKHALASNVLLLSVCRSSMDDLRLLQAFRWPAYDWRSRTAERDCKGLSLLKRLGWNGESACLYEYRRQAFAYAIDTKQASGSGIGDYSHHSSLSCCIFSPSTCDFRRY